MIHVTPLSRIDETIRLSGGRTVLSLLSEGTAMERPAGIAADRHRVIRMHDIAEPRAGLVLPGEAHMQELLAFARAWDRSAPLVVNCYAGISRSTAGAYIIAAALAPNRDETELAQTLRKLSPSATPNPRLIALADAILGRDGRMVAAVASIGRGADAFEGTPFAFPVER